MAGDGRLKSLQQPREVPLRGLLASLCPRFRATTLVLACTTIVTGCLRDLDPRLGERHTVAGGKAKEGAAAIRAYGCGNCHVIPGVRGARGRAGPPLVAWSGRRFIAGRVPNTPDQLVSWIIHPQGIKPGTAMPDLGVTDQDARHIAAYLYTLKE